MSINELPPTVYVAMGTLFASLIAGVFSYLNMIVSKENKVSEFRLGWIDGLRNEVAEYTASMQNLSFIIEVYNELPETIASNEHLSWLSEIVEQRKIAIECITKIRLRLNHKEVELNEESAERKLISAIESAREHLNDLKYDDVMEDSDLIRVHASPLLKSSWETVKSGERRYLKIKKRTELVLFLVFLSIPATLTYQLHNEHKKSIQQQKSIDSLIEKMNKNLEVINKETNEEKKP
ncbi:hypothetical protein [Pantoea sp. A4]|uniref:hypothetical protein n=1 Tax=Pantoea sp. A4 TaxID=1225184 RepID=UPI00037ADC82|nr:hypothetical protein [Pantoea sp. A4]